VPLPVARQTPNLEENQWFRAFQLSPQEVPSIWSEASEPSSGRWNYGRENGWEFCRKWRLPRHFWVLLHAVKHGIGQTALLPLRRKACWRLFRPKNLTASAGFEPANLGTKGQHATCRPPKHPKDYIHEFWQKYDDRISLLRLCRYFYTQFCFDILWFIPSRCLEVSKEFTYRVKTSYITPRVHRFPKYPGATTKF
jgi:hypothetical protein